MSLDLDSNSLSFHLRLPEGRWDLLARPGPFPRVESAGMALRWRRGNLQRAWEGRMVQAITHTSAHGAEVAGATHQAAAEWRLPEDEIGLRVECALALHSPLFLWRLRVENQGQEPIRLARIDMLRVGTPQASAHLPRSRPGRRAGGSSKAAEIGSLRLDAAPGFPAFFTNGWQSWSYTGALGGGERLPRTRLGPLTRPMRENPGTPYPGGRGLFSADMFGVLGDRRSRTGILAGFLSQKQAFGYLEARLDAMAPRLRLAVTCDDLLLEPGEAFTTDWACLQLVSLDDPAPLEPYLEAVALKNQARRAAPVPVGWCSWYYYFDHVAQENWQAHLSWAKEHRPEIPFDVIQLDDGFEADVGDWFATNHRFPEGLAPQVQRIRDAGFRAGLWLAPFLAKSKARLVQEHPDWVLRTPRGHAVNPGFLWNTFPWALDVSLPAVLDHVRRVVHTASHEWGFDYLKLDFLYAAALQGRRHDPRVTRAQALRTALEAMREGAGEQVTLVGCGCPIGSGIGIFDVMRIGADVHSFWHPAYLNVPLSILRPEPDFPSARNSLRNTLTRAPLHRRWWVNDPDCVILRSQETHLTAAEAQTLATLVSLSAGSLLDSDSLPDLSPERREWLARLIPPLPEAVRVIDWFDAAYPSLLTLPLSGAAGRWHLVAVVNWDEGPRTREVDSSVFGLPHANAYHAVDFWAGRYERLAGSTLHFPSIPPHGVRLLALRPATGDAPEWLGDTLHISQGLQVTSWVAQEGRLKCRIDLGRKASGRAWLALPARPVAVSLNGRPLEADWQSTGVCAVPLEFEGEAILEVAWS